MYNKSKKINIYPYLSTSYHLQIGLLNEIGFHERCNFIAQYLNSLTRGFTTCLAYKVYMTLKTEKNSGIY